MDLPRGAPLERQHERYRLVRPLRQRRHHVRHASRVGQRHRDADRQCGRRADGQLPHGLHAARSGDGHEPDDDQDQGLGRQRAREPGSTRRPTASARRSPAAAGCAATPRRSTTNTPLTSLVDNYSPSRPSLVHRYRSLRLRHRRRPGRRDVRRRGRHRPRAAATTATASLLDAIPGTVFTIGDTVYPNGTAATSPTTSRRPGAATRPDHPGGGQPRVPDRQRHGLLHVLRRRRRRSAKGYYSNDLGAWHVIVLNGNCSIISCAAGSAQEQWLRADLAANTALCTVALFHQPRFSSGSIHGNNTAAGADLERALRVQRRPRAQRPRPRLRAVRPQTPGGVADPVRGIREFVVGTGGDGPRGFGTIRRTARSARTTIGVLKLTLKAAGYDFQFVPIAGQTFTDSGSGTCH